MVEEGLFGGKTFKTPKANIIAVLMLVYILKQTGNVGDWSIMFITV